MSKVSLQLIPTPILNHYSNLIENTVKTKTLESISSEFLFENETNFLQEYFDNNFDGYLEEFPPDAELHPASNYENSFSLEASPLKFILILASIWLLGIVFYTQEQKHTNCLLNEDTNGMPKIVDANVYQRNSGFHPMQSQILEMFLSENEYEEENSMMQIMLDKLNRMCSKDAFFYGQNSNYMKAAMMLKEMLNSINSPMLMLETGMKLKPHLNTKLWYNGLMHAKQSRLDMQDIILPSAIEAMPDSFISGLMDKKKKNKKCVRVDGRIGRDNGVENKLWYFREDVMVNSHHYYWHLSWPLALRKGQMLDRRGELFYFMHRSLLNRYNIERITNKFEIASPINYKEPILPQYNPHLTDANSGQNWTPRIGAKFVRDIDHRGSYTNSQILVRISNWFQIRDRLFKAILSGKWVLPFGIRPIPTDKGIDQLGNTLEAVDTSVNPNYYGQDGYHNDGHRVLGFISDPKYEEMLPPGVMADQATAMRDPIFYRFHTNVNNMFEAYKSTLDPYGYSWGPHPLHFQGFYIKSVKVKNKRDGHINKLSTFYKVTKFPLHMGLAFNTTNLDDANIKVCSKHIDHDEFDYEFEVHKSSCVKARSTTFRIFIAPRFNSKRERLSIHEQRMLFVHLDLFNVDLPHGKSIVKRSSLSSSLTILSQKTLAQLNSATQQR